MRVIYLKQGTVTCIEVRRTCVFEVADKIPVVYFECHTDYDSFFIKCESKLKAESIVFSCARDGWIDLRQERVYSSLQELSSVSIKDEIPTGKVTFY